MFNLTPALKRKYIAMIVLNEIIKNNRVYDVNFIGANDIFPMLMSEDIIKMKGTQFIPTKKGIELHSNQQLAYQEFNRFFNPFCAVDMHDDIVEFAHSKYYDFANDDEFNVYLNDDKWWDLRIAICEFKSHLLIVSN